MAEFIIQNPSITPNVFEYDEAGRVSAISGYPLAGGGGGTIVKSDLMWKPSVESDGYVHWTLASSATTPAAAYISGAQGPAGPQGVSGNPGKTPELQINPTDAHWQWRYSGDAGWTDLGVIASGAVGPQGPSGTSGANGKDGISPKVRINSETNKWEISEDNGATWTPTNVSATGPAGEDGTNGISPTVSTSAIPGGNRVTFTYDDGGTTATESIDVMSGASGANGAAGFSPTVTITDAPTTEHPQGGKTVTITDIDHPTGQSFDIWNGIDGQGATVNLLEGDGIQITHEAGTTNYTIAVSADYATKSYVDSASAYALSQAETWVGNQHYLTSVPDTYALKSDIPTKVAQLTDSGNYYKKTETSGATEITNALNTKLDSTAAAQTYQTKSDMTNYLTTSDASTTYQPKGDYATKTYVNEASANAYDKAVAQIPNVSNFITKDADNLTYYYKKTETSGTTELATEFAKYVIKPDTTQSVLNNNYLIYSTLTGQGTTTGWIPLSANYYSKSEADGRYIQQTFIDTTLSGTGTNAGNKLGVNTSAIPTMDWLDDNYLPLSGGTVTGQLTISGDGFNKNLYLKRDNNDGFIGLAGNGAITLKNNVNGSTSQIEFLTSNSKTFDITVKDNSTTPQPVGKLYVMSAHSLADAAATSANWANDGMLHIILES